MLFWRCFPPSSVFILPPTLRGLFSRAGGGKVSSLPVRGGVLCSHLCRKATLSGSPLLILCARGKRLVSPRERVPCVHVGSVRARVHPDGLLWLDNEGKEVSHSSRVAETTRGFPWLLPPLAGRSRVATGRKYAIPRLLLLTSPHAVIRARLLSSVARVCACVCVWKSLQAEAASRALNANSPRARVDLLARSILRWDARASL